MPELTLDSLAAEIPAALPPPSAVEARARFFVRLVQGTMALEGQAVSASSERQLVEQAAGQLLADPRQEWGER